MWCKWVILNFPSFNTISYCCQNADRQGKYSTVSQPDANLLLLDCAAKFRGKRTLLQEPAVNMSSPRTINNDQMIFWVECGNSESLLLGLNRFLMISCNRLNSNTKKYVRKSTFYFNIIQRFLFSWKYMEHELSSRRLSQLAWIPKVQLLFQQFVIYNL